MSFCSEHRPFTVLSNHRNGDDTHESVKFLEFNSKTFFFFLLPLIILVSAYWLRDRAFLENFGTIVVYAVAGTVLNIVLLGGSLIAFSNMGKMTDFWD